MGMRIHRRKPIAKDDMHSTVVGGSTAKLRRMCPLSIEEERKVPKEPSSIYADTGTALHHVVEQAIADGMSNKAVLREFTGVVIELDGMAHPIELTEDLLRAKALPALDWFDQTICADASIHLEKKMAFPGIDGAFGTSDVVFTDDDDAGIIDWKFGDGVIVSADDNDQMRFYLCSAIGAGLLPPDLPAYVAYIFQPAAKLEPHEYASRGIYTAEDLERFREDLHDAIDTWRNGEATHVTGDHCTWCKGKLACKAYNKMITMAVETDIEGCTTFDLVRMLELMPAVKAYCSAVYSAALRNAQNGAELPGYSLETSIGNRTYADPDAAWAALGRLGLPADQRTVKTVLPAPQALEKLKEIGTPKAKIERFEKTHIIRPENGEKLVKVKGKGKPSGSAMTRLAGALKARGL